LKIIPFISETIENFFDRSLW